MKAAVKTLAANAQLSAEEAAPATGLGEPSESRGRSASHFAEEQVVGLRWGMRFWVVSSRFTAICLRCSLVGLQCCPEGEQADGRACGQNDSVQVTYRSEIARILSKTGFL